MAWLHAHLQIVVEGVIMGGNHSGRKLTVSYFQATTNTKFIVLIIPYMVRRNYIISAF